MSKLVETVDPRFAEAYHELDPAAMLRKPGDFLDAMCCIVEGLRDGTPFYLAPEVAFRPSEVTLWGGMNGHGKSLLTGQLAMQLAENGEKPCVMSLEMDPERTLLRMARQWLGRRPQNALECTQFVEHFQEMMLLFDFQGAVDLDVLYGAIVVAAQQKFCTHIFVDNLMKCVAGEDDYNAQKNFVQTLCALAKQLRVHIHLVHHARKGKDENEEVGKFSFKGSGAVVDQVDNAILIQRNRSKEKKRLDGVLTPAEDHTEGDSIMRVVKQRNGDWEGDKILWFEPRAAAFSDNCDRTTPWEAKK